jgi:hypothetical protein
MFRNHHDNEHQTRLAGIIGRVEFGNAESAVGTQWREAKEAQRKNADEVQRLELEEYAAIQAERDLLSGGGSGAAQRGLASRARRASIHLARFGTITGLPPAAQFGAKLIVPRAQPEREGFDPERYDYRPDLFLLVQNAASPPSASARDTGPSETFTSTMGHRVEPAMSMTAEQRAAWEAEVQALSEAEAKKRYPGEARTHRRVISDAGRRECAVAERWRRSFKAFLLDVGPKPSPSFTLDRTNPLDPVYGPGRCAWRSPRDQANNRTSNVRLTATWEREVRTMTIADWASLTGQPAANVHKRHQRRKPGVPDWKVIGAGAGPTPSDHTVSPAHPPPPGWERCPYVLARMLAEAGTPCPSKGLALHHAAFQKAFPLAKRLLASVPVFLAWHARERLAAAEHVLVEVWSMRDWAGTGWVPKELVDDPLLRDFLDSRAILTGAEAMLTDAEWEFLESLRHPVADIVNRKRVPIPDALAPLRAAMKWAKAPPSNWE